MTALEKNGVKKFSPLGEDFDPSHAQAIATVPGDMERSLKLFSPDMNSMAESSALRLVKVGE